MWAFKEWLYRTRKKLASTDPDLYIGIAVIGCIWAVALWLLYSIASEQDCRRSGGVYTEQGCEERPPPRFMYYIPVERQLIPEHERAESQ